MVISTLFIIFLVLELGLVDVAVSRTPDQRGNGSDVGDIASDVFEKSYSFGVPVDVGPPYGLNVHLGIPGDIILETNDRDQAKILFSLRASTANWGELENINVDFNIDEKTKTLNVFTRHQSEIDKPEAPPCAEAWKPIQSQGLLFVLLGISAIIHQKHGGLALMCFLGISSLSAFVYSMSSSHRVDVVISVPRGYSFSSLSLHTVDGKVKVEEHHVSANPTLQCSTQHENSICPSCCRGLGECIDGTCLCYNSQASYQLGCDPTEVTFRLTVENFQSDNSRDFRYSTCIHTLRKTLEEILLDNGDVNPTLRYESISPEDSKRRNLFGFADNQETGVAWTVSRRNPDGSECQKNQLTDAFTIVPENSEHIILLYKKRDIGANREQCENLNTATTECPKYPPDIYVTVSDASSPVPSRMRLSVENMITGDVTEFTFSLCAQVGNNITLLEIMNATASINPALTYKTKSFSFGEYIYKINGLSESQVNSTYWAIIRRDPFGHDCLTSVGASDYSPRPGEHLVLSYQTYNAYENMPSCVDQPEEQIPAFNLEDACFA